MDQRIVNLCDEYRHGLIDRREFLRKFYIAAGGIAAAHALLPFFENRQVRAEVVPKDDPRLETQEIKYAGETGDLRAYVAKPKGDEKLPGVIVIHENRGLVPHIKDVTRRMALEGFLAMAPDALSPLGGTPDDPEKAPALIQKLDSRSNIQNYLAAVRYLASHPSCTRKIGVIGFCWGGGVANQLAVHSADLSAVVPFYGMQPATEDVPKIKVPLLLHYAGVDERINKGIPAFEDALKKAGVDYRIYMYEGAQHAFLNDTNPARYHRQAAELAWQRTVQFLKERLKP